MAISKMDGTSILDKIGFCPHCGAPMEAEAPLPEMTHRERIIYDAVSASGTKGLTKEDLIKIVYKDRKRASSAWPIMRVAVHYLNKKLQPYGRRIRGRRQVGYTLIDLPTNGDRQ